MSLDLGRIGGSDAPAIVGHYYPEVAVQLPERYSAYAVWARIVHGVHADDPQLAEHARWGKRLERPIHEGWLAETGRNPADWTWTGDQSQNHPTRPWQRISPDAISGAPGFGGELADIKFPNPFAAHDMREGVVPVQYEIQLQTYLEALNMDRAYLVPLIGGTIHEIPIERSTPIGEVIVESCERFWRDHVLTGKAPAPDGSATTHRVIAARWGRIGLARPPRRATEEELALYDSVRLARAAHEAAEEHFEALRNRMRDMIGDADAIALPGAGTKQPRITNRWQAGRATTDWQAVCRDLATDLEAIPKVIALHTKPGAPYRVLRFPATKETE